MTTQALTDTCMRRGMFAIVSSFVLTACSSDGGGGGAAPGSLLALGCDDALDSVYRSQTPPPDWVDRPPPDPTIPIFYWTGGMDDFIPPGFQKCGLDRLEGQGANVTACVERDSDHSGIVSRTAGWVRQHLEEVLLGGDAPEPCEALDPALECSIPIVPNSSDPADP
ncbi:MAG: hypothetical protein OEM15_11130 [Myxococcales bacterium]|nr:hypothetical protein [Myxococcales bacterium]MDH3483161.1 hypothetical protein [Myxococcales bacterium]